MDDFCRICRGTSEEEPLSQPCRCDGSVRFIHQSCLQQWLAVSNKKTCELCKFEFVFTPVYADNAPESIPFITVFKIVFFNCGSHILKFTRFTTVSFLWLIFIPWVLFLFTFTLFNTINFIPHPVERLAMATLFPNPIRAAEILEGQIIYVGMISVAIMLFFAKELLGLDQIEDPNRILIERARQQVLRAQLRARLERREENVLIPEAVNHRRFGMGEGQPELHNRLNHLTLDDRRELARLRIERLERMRAESSSSDAEFFSIPAVSSEESSEEADHNQDENQDENQGDSEEDILGENVDLRAEAPEPVRVELPVPGMNNEPDSISELLGFTGSLNHAIYTAIVVVACLFGLVVSMGYIPFVLGYFSIYVMSTSKLFGPWLLFINNIKSWLFNLFNVSLELNISSKLLANTLTSTSWSPRLLLIGIGYIWISFCIVIILAIVASKQNSNSFASKVIFLLDSKLKNFIKISVFLSAELVGFPLYTGALLDITTALVMSWELNAMLTFMTRYPIISLFLHWFIGTLFMFNFSVIVDKIRQVIRPGVLWFLRDPNDADFKPIKEIIEQPVLKQVRKLLISAVMYFGFVFFGYGVFLIILTKSFSPLSIAPFRTNFSSFTEFPLDLLVFHFFLPIIYKVLQPKERIKTICHFILSFYSQLLHLSSYIFGGRHVQEEQDTMLVIDHVLVPKTIEINPDDFISPSNHTLILCPNRDSLKLPPSVTLFYHPVSSIDEKDLIIEKYHLNPRDYTFTLIPSYLKTRLWSLFLLFWSNFIGGIVVAIYSCIIIGRQVLDLFFTESHDIYAFLLGCSIICVLFYSLFLLKHIDKSNIFHIAASVSSVCFFFLIVFPMGLMSLINCYLMMPSQMHNEKTIMRFYLHEWAIGVIYCRVLYVFIQMGPANAFQLTIRRLFHGGWHQFPLKFFYQTIVFKLLLLLIISHGAPYGMGVLLGHALRTFIFI